MHNAMHVEDPAASMGCVPVDGACLPQLLLYRDPSCQCRLFLLPGRSSSFLTNLVPFQPLSRWLVHDEVASFPR